MKWLSMVISIVLLPVIALAVPEDDGEIIYGSDDGTILIELQADTLSPYLQAQTLITLRLYRDPDSFDAAMSYPELSEPLIDRNVMLRNIEVNERRYRQYKDNKLYTVTERQYVVYPEQSGHMRIGPSIFKGHIVKGGTIQFVQIDSNVLDLDVRPIPESFTGNIWIPARSIELYQDFQPTDDSFEIGKPLSRNLFISATGLGSGHIPSFHSEQIPGFRIYPRQTKREELEHAESGLIAVLQQELAMVPTAVGEYEIPAIQVPWWNTIKDKEEVASFPGKKITILPVTGSTDLQDSRERKDYLRGDKQIGRDLLEHIEQRPLIALLAGIILVLSIYLVFVLTKRISLWREYTLASKSSILRRAITACYTDNAFDASRLIIQYANECIPDITTRSLLDLSNRVDKEMATELLRLNDALYSSTTVDWHGDKLAEQLKCRMVNTEHIKFRANLQYVPELHPLSAGK